jgi:hypothetical protein
MIKSTIRTIIICGGDTTDHTAMRISISSWATRDEDVDRSVAAILRAAHD